MGFRGDERAQSIQVGAILLFGFLIIGLSVHQAVIVPNQNRHVEFNHFSDTQNKMEVLRNEVIRAGQTGETVPVGVTLGTAYPPRLLAFQPQRSYGSLRTATIGGSGNALELRNTTANVTTVCGLASPTTRTVTYRPSYNYLDSVENITYENTVAYTTGRSGERFVQTDQQLVEDDTIHLYPLLGDYDRSGSGVASVTFRGGPTGANESVPGPFTLVLPTQLPASAWQALLSNQSHVTGVSPVAGRQAVEVSFASGERYGIKCSPVGAGTAPNNTPTVGGGDGEGGINPAPPGDVQLLAERQADNLSKGAIELKFANQADGPARVVEARVNFFQSDAKRSKQPDQFRIYNGTSQEAGVLPRGGTYQELRPDVVFPANQTRIIRIDLEQSDGNDVNSLSSVGDGWFVLTLRFESGESGQYFIRIPDDDTF